MSTQQQSIGSAATLRAPQRNLRRFVPWALLLLVLAVLPHLFDSRYAISLLNQMGIGIVFALSYNMLLGQTGLLSFGHAVYFGLGGFTTLHMINWISGGDIPFPVVLFPVAGAAGGLLFGILFGAVSTKRAGTIFAMISLGIGELVAASSHVIPGFFGGEEGISADRMSGLPVLGLSMGPQGDVYYLIAGWAFVSIVLMYLITRTPLGRMANAVRDNPERAEFIGYSTRRVRFLMFSLSGLFAGVAGALFAVNYEILTAETVGGTTSGSVLLMAYVGGIGHFIGPILGAILITLADVSLSGFTEAWMFYLGVFFILVIMYAPGGIAGIVLVHEPVAKYGLLGRLAVPYLKAGVPMVLAIVGGIVLVEINYHLSLQGSFGTEMSLFGITFDAASAPPWIVGIGLLAVGLWLFRRTLPDVAGAWEKVRGEMKARAQQ